jgi:two-component system, response regulator YesN
MIDMFKLMVADDEPKIRIGLSEALDWEALNISVIGIARDGEEALMLASENKPDICLIDICMPVINGLDLIEKLREQNPNVITIIITGHDEFDYAQKAVKLDVFDYILKPVCEDELLKVIERAKKELEETVGREKRYEWADIQLKKNMGVMKERFFSEWINGQVTGDEIEEQLKFYNIELGTRLGLVLLKTQGINLGGKSRIEWERQLLLFAIQNIFEEMLDPLKTFIMTRDNNENYVALVSLNDKKAWDSLKLQTENNTEKYLEHRVVVYQKEVSGGINEVSFTYEEIKRIMFNDSHCLPVVRKVKLYIEKNYMDSQLSIKKIADDLNISVGHLSKLFKQELGMSFTDYLIKIRITESIKLINNDTMKIYEIADRVGYSSQHYFCAAFKNVLGISPTEYRQRENGRN